MTTSEQRPINDHCARFIAEQLRQAEEAKRATPCGHDAGDEDPNAW
jgi:hypothetical protein